MKGQVIKRGEKCYMVRIPLGSGPDGKRLYHNHTVHGTKKDAESYRVQKLEELNRGMLIQQSRETLTEFVTRWLDTVVRHGVRPRTFEDYNSLAARHLLPKIGHKPLGKLQSSDIQAVYSFMQDAGLSARTVRYVHSILHNALEHAVRTQLLARNPSKQVVLPRMVRREMATLTIEGAQRLLVNARQVRFGALWALLLITGMRPCEALALRWSDIYGTVVRITRSVVRTATGEPHFGPPKTPKGRRTIPLPASLLKWLDNHKAAQQDERAAAGALWDEQNLVFCNSLGGLLDWRTVSRRYLKPLLADCGSSNLRPYDLRHTCATLLLAMGENVKVVQERLGHSTASMTLDVYSHVLPDMQQGATTKLEASLFRRAATTTMNEGGGSDEPPPSSVTSQQSEQRNLGAGRR